MGKMSGIVYSNPLNPLDVVEERLHRHVLSFVLDSVDEESRNFDVA